MGFHLVGKFKKKTLSASPILTLPLTYLIRKVADQVRSEPFSPDPDFSLDSNLNLDPILSM